MAKELRAHEPMPPDFSLVIPCLSTPETLNRLLTSIAGQDFGGSVEVVVCDDGSAPSLQTCAEAWKDRLNVNYQRSEINRGRAAARNMGLRASRGRIMFFLDVDQILLPHCLSAMESHFTGPNPLSVRANVALDPALRASSNYGKYYNSRFPGQRPPKEIAKLDLGRLPPKFFATGSMAISRTAYDLVGLFDEEFREYGCEDEDYGIRLSELGVPLVWSLQADVYDSDDRISFRRACDRMTAYAQYSMVILLKKHPSYARQTALGIFEVPVGELNLKSKLVRSLLIRTLTPKLAKWLLEMLERRDDSKRQPAGYYYQLALAGFYLIGLRRRAG